MNGDFCYVQSEPAEPPSPAATGSYMKADVWQPEDWKQKDGLKLSDAPPASVTLGMDQSHSSSGFTFTLLFYTLEFPLNSGGMVQEQL